MQPKITIQLVTWNSAHDLEHTLPTLQKIPFEQSVIRCIDNHSTDNSVLLVRRFLPHADIITLPNNTGFSGGHNIGFARCDTSLVMTLNPDVKISWDGIQKLIKEFDDPKLAAVQGKLLKEQTPSNQKTIIDSAGVVLTLALNGRDRGADEEDRGQYNNPALLNAITGACGVYRLEALRSVAYSSQEFFDQDFFAYKEDVDLGWRLNKVGWKIMYQPIITGTHIRVLKREGVLNWGVNPQTIYRRLSSPRTRYSLRNWIWMITKNMTPKQYFMHWIFIKIRLAVFLALSLLYWPLFKVWTEAFRGLPKMWRKRKLLANH